MLKVTHPRGKTEITLGNYKMSISTKEINPDRLADALEMLTEHYTHSKETHLHTLRQFNTLLYDYGELKKKYEELQKKLEPDEV